jgi:DNA primase
MFDYKLKVLKIRYDINEIEGKARISSEMLSTINKFKNAVLRSEYTRLLAEELNVKEEALLQELNKIKDKPGNQYINFSQNIPNRKPLSINPTEKLLIKLMLEENEYISRIRESLTPTDFHDERIRRIVETMFSLLEQGKDIQPCSLINYLGESDVLEIISESSFLPEVSSQNKEKIVDDCIQRIKDERMKSKRLYLHDQIKAAQRLGNEEQLQTLMQEFHSLIKKGE